MKVAWILESGGLSGGVWCIIENANRLAQRGYEVLILSLDEPSKWTEISHKVGWRRFGSYEAMVEGCNTIRPDIVFATWWKTAYAVKEIRDQTQCRGAYYVQDIETAYYFDPAHRGAVMDTYGFGLEHVTTSKWVKSQMPEAHYVGLARKTSFRPGETSRNRGALAVLRRQALKGWRELVELNGYLAKNNIPLITYGVDQGREIAGNHKHHSSISDKNVRELFQKTAVFVSTSLHEGLSLSPLEAMASGCPVVMFDCDGNMEYAKHDDNCLIATDPGDMYRQIERIFTDKPLAARLSKSGLVTAKQYASWDGPIDRMVEFLERPAVDKPTEDVVLSETVTD